MLKLLYYKILNYQPSNLKLLNDNFNVITLDNPNEDSDEILVDIDVGLAPLGFQFNKEKIDKMLKLKVIGSNTTGEPHINRQHAESKGIKVFSLKYEQEFLKTITPTAEHTWGLLLALTRKTPWAFQATLNGNWNRWDFGGKNMLSQMSIGIAGLGRLGSLVAQYAKAFQMKQIQYYDPYREDAVGIIKVNTLEELVSQNDIITIHIPAEKETHKLFNQELFNKFKQGSYLINTSRGEIVDEEAMINALESGKLVGAAIDVFDGEYNINRDELWQKNILYKYAKKHDNFLATPHIGGSTLDAWELTEKKIINNILDYLKLNL